MRATRAHVAAAAAIVERDLRLMLSYRLRPLALVLAPIATVTLFYYVSRLVRIDAVGLSDGYFAYVVVGVVGLTVLTSTLATTPATLRQEMVAGTLERLVVCPFGAVRAIIAMLIFPLAQSLVVAFTTVASAALVFGMPLAWPNLLLSPPAAVLGAIAFAPFGVLALAAMLVVKQTLAGVSIVLTGLSIFAGVYFPISLLPDWIQWGADVQPFTPALDLLRQLLTSEPDAGSAWLDVAKLLGFTTVLLPVSVVVLQRALSHGRLRGTITEY
jgi:ABC-2 type transport system permease protein